MASTSEHLQRNLFFFKIEKARDPLKIAVKMQEPRLLVGRGGNHPRIRSSFTAEGAESAEEHLFKRFR